MGAFRQGQKVRVVHSENERMKRFIGTITTVCEADVFHPLYILLGRGEALYALEGIGGINLEGAHEFLWAESHLAPVEDDDDSRQIVKWEDCLWQPEKETA